MPSQGSARFWPRHFHFARREKTVFRVLASFGDFFRVFNLVTFSELFRVFFDGSLKKETNKQTPP
jgi:hypothetical protein